jgi:hypothetical protein
LISGNGETSSRLPAFSLFLPGSCPNNRDRRTDICIELRENAVVACLADIAQLRFALDFGIGSAEPE